MRSARAWAGPLLAAFWPFAFFWRFVLPIPGSHLAIGNDFDHLYYRYKLVLIDGLSRGRFPLWSPSEAAGFPLYSNPFTAAFYPLNIVLVAIYRFTGGYGWLDHQIFTVAGVAIFSLGIYQWLEAMGFGSRPALFAACAMSISFRVCDTMRFPNAIHTAAWYPWLLLALYRIFSARDRGALARWTAVLAASLACFLTAGYPYYVYYAQFLILPYLAALAVPWARRRVFPSIPEGAPGPRPWLMAGAASLIGALLGLPYLLAVSGLMRSTQDRGGGDFQYSTEHFFRFRDTLTSFVYPPASESEGWYYFGLAGTLLLAMFVVRSAAHAPAGPGAHGRAFVGLLLGWMAFVSSVTYGRDSRLFVWLWSHWPFFSRLRVWGRMNVILLLPLAWLLAAAYSWWEGWLERPKSLRGKRDWLVVATLCAGYLAALGAQTWMLRHQIFNSYWKIWFPHLWGLESSFVRTGFLSFCALAIPALLSFGKGLSGLQASMAAAALIVATGADIYPIGSRVWITYSPPPRRARLDLEAQYRQSFAVCRKDEPPGTVTLSPAFNAWVVPNWDYHRYVEFRSHAAAERDAEGELLGITGCRKIFQTADVRHPQIRSFLEDAAGFGGTFRLVDYDGDLLRLKVAMPRPGHVSFIDNWDPGWRALVDGESRPIELLYGTFKSVSVGAGEHEVVFVYRPSLSGRGASGLLR